MSSVDWSARGQRNFRFALRSPDGAISGQKRVFLGCFLGFLAPRQAGRPGEPRSGQSEAEFGAGLAFTYIHNREMGGGTEGGHFWSKRGSLGCFLGFSAPKQAGRPGEGRKTRGRPLRAAYETVPRCSIWYGANDLIKVPRLSNIPHHIFDTTYPSQSYQSWHHRFWYHKAPHIWAPHIWHLIFGTSPRHLTFRHHISKPTLPILTRYFS